MIFKTYYQSPLGRLMLASDGENLLGLWTEGQKYFASTIKEEMVINDHLAIFIKTKEWLDQYFRQENPALSQIPLAPSGSDFRQAVWQILSTIPYGKTITYNEIAKRIAVQFGYKSMSAQAIGGAVGHNPISIIIPCHRVIRKDGELAGYAGGIEMKIKLLELEKK